MRRLLEEVAQGDQSVDDALASLRDLPFQDLGFAKVDHHRQLRNGFPEVIYCPGKTPYEARAIAEAIVSRGSNLLATRATRDTYAAIQEVVPDAVYSERGRTITHVQSPVETREGILVVSAGTSDLHAAEEAYETATIMGNKVDRLYDVGVAGIHRLLSHTALITSARVVIVVAGMEGALPSVVGGLVSVPVIAVPTSAGYGASLGGIAALLAMLNTCASGVTVVNIDNGFGAGYAAALMNRLDGKTSESA